MNSVIKISNLIDENILIKIYDSTVSKVSIDIFNDVDNVVNLKVMIPTYDQMEQLIVKQLKSYSFYGIN